MIETLIKQRGKASVELKLRHMIPEASKKRREKYRVDLHLFLPGAFAASPTSPFSISRISCRTLQRSPHRYRLSSARRLSK